MNDYVSVQQETPMIALPFWVFESTLSDGAVRLYAILLIHAERGQFPGFEQLARDFKRSIPTTKKYLSELERFGALTSSKAAGYAIRFHRPEQVK